jgi:hypothetical protein
MVVIDAPGPGTAVFDAWEPIRAFGASPRPRSRCDRFSEATVGPEVKERKSCEPHRHRMLLGSIAAMHGAHGPGCLSGAAGGALAGRLADHGLSGAAGGCIEGYEWHKQQPREQDLQSPGAYDTRRRQYDLNYQSPFEH